MASRWSRSRTWAYTVAVTGGHADVGMAQQFLDHDEFDALFQEERCR